MSCSPTNGPASGSGATGTGLVTGRAALGDTASEIATLIAEGLLLLAIARPLLTIAPTGIQAGSTRQPIGPALDHDGSAAAP